MSETHRPRPLEAIPLNLQIFHPDPDLHTPSYPLYTARYRPVILSPTADDTYSISLFGASRPIHCQLKVVPRLCRGSLRNEFSNEFTVPIARGNLPLWISFVSLPTYAAVLIPIFARVGLPRASQTFGTNEGPATAAELHEHKQKTLDGFHLRIIHTPGRRGKPPPGRAELDERFHTVLNRIINAA